MPITELVIPPPEAGAVRAESRDDEFTLEAFQELLLQLTGRRVPGLAEMVPQSDPAQRN